MPLLAGAILLTGAYGTKRAGDAADEQSAAARAAGQRSERQFNITRNDLAPYRTVGDQALGRISRAFGLGGADPDLSEFYQDPGYQFRLDEGNKALDRSAAGRGMLLSGAQLKSLNRFNQGMASQEFGNWFNRLYGLAGMGQNAAVQTGNFGANAVNQANQAYMYGADARANGIANQTNFLTNTVNELGTLYGQRSTGYAPPPQADIAAVAPPNQINSMYGGYV